MFNSSLNVSSTLPIKLYQRVKQVLPGFPILPIGMMFFNTVHAQDRLSRGFDHGPGLGGSFFSFLMSLLFLALLVLAVLYLFQLYRSRQNPSGVNIGTQISTPTYAPDAALQMLRERLAKGEIDVEDYEARRRVLLGKNETGKDETA
jgi:uncharacterized membrane protein